MKLYKKYIDSCIECPNCSLEMAMHEKTKFFCELTGKDLPNISIIPNECPLESSKQTK